MSNLIEQVREFTKIAGCTVDTFNPGQAGLYMGLIREEDSEWMEELFKGHYPEWLPVQISDLKGMASLFKSGEFNNIIKDVDRAKRAKLAHELADLAWVTIGALFSLGVDVEGVFNELTRANMDKAIDCPECRGEGFYIQEDIMTDGTCQTCNGTGKVMMKNEYGKVVKPEGWRKADMTPFVAELTGIEMIWINVKDRLPPSGLTVLAKKDQFSKPESVYSDNIRHHLSQYKFWSYCPDYDVIA